MYMYVRICMYVCMYVQYVYIIGYIHTEILKMSDLIGLRNVCGLVKTVTIARIDNDYYRVLQLKT